MRRPLILLTSMLLAGCVSPMGPMGTTPVALMRIPGTAEYTLCFPGAKSAGANQAVAGAAFGVHAAQLLSYDACVRAAEEQGYVMVSGQPPHDESKTIPPQR